MAYTFLKKANNAKSTLNGGITSGSGTLIVTSASSFPNSGSFMCTIWNKTTYPDPTDDANMEIVKVTSVSSNTFTITRAQESTSAHAHSSGDEIEILFTIGQIQELETQINALINAPSGWTDDGTVVRLTTSTDSVGIGTASPRGPTDINQPTLSVGNATLNPIVFNYGSGSNYTNDNNHFGYTLYAKKVSGADTVYSAVGSSQTAVDDGGTGMNYTITLSWSAVSGATGYKIVVDNDEWYGAAGDYVITTALTSVTIDGGNIYSGESPPIVTPTTVGPDFYFDATGNIIFTNGAFKINGSVGTSPGGSSVPVGSIIQPGNVLRMETNTDAYAGVGGGVRLTLVNEDYHNGALFTNKSLDLVDFQFNGVTNPSSHFLTIRWEGRNAYNRNSANNSQGELQLGSTTAGDGIPAFCTGDGATILARGKFVLFDGINFELNTTNGTKFGTATSQKLAFFNSTPIVQPANTVAINDVLVNLGLRAASGASNFTTKLQIPSLAASTTEGDFWSDSTQKAIATFTDGIKQMLSGCIFTQTADKSVTNTVTETSIIGTGVGTLTLPANFFVAGKTIRIRVGGIYSTPIAATPSLVIKVKYGSTVIATVTTTGLLSGATTLEFDGEILITCRTTGSSGTVMVHGDIEYATGVGGTISVDPLNNAGATTTINTTTSNALDITVTWDSATSTRIAKSTVCTAEVLN